VARAGKRVRVRASLHPQPEEHTMSEDPTRYIPVMPPKPDDPDDDDEDDEV
jgi:hypothetical protein